VRRGGGGECKADQKGGAKRGCQKEGSQGRGGKKKGCRVWSSSKKGVFSSGKKGRVKLRAIEWSKKGVRNPKDPKGMENKHEEFYWGWLERKGER